MAGLGTFQRTYGLLAGGGCQGDESDLGCEPGVRDAYSSNAGTKFDFNFILFLIFVVSGRGGFAVLSSPIVVMYFDLINTLHIQLL
jgi:hypothetical protein